MCILITSVLGDAIAQSLAGDRDAIPDAATALRVGLALLEAHYGVEVVKEGQPYEAVLLRDEWLVVPHKPVPGTYGGGRPNISLSKRDGQVTTMALSK